MAVVQIKERFLGDVQRVWEVVTHVAGYPSWRSDLGRVEVLDGGRFVEYTSQGYATTFTVTTEEPCRRWEFDMENNHMRGHWTGVFAQKGNEVQVEFTEDVTAKKLFMRPFVKGYLKKQQARFIAGLRRALGAA